MSMKKIITSSTASLLTVLSVATPVGAQLGDFQLPERGFADNLGTYFASLLSLVLVISALLVFFQLIFGGIQWILSGGDKGKTEAARGRIVSAIIGIIILSASYAILLLILNFLGFNNLQELLESMQTING